MDRRSCLVAMAAAMAASTRSLASPAYPDRPLRMIVGFTPGGPNDIVARILAKELSDSLGQPVVVENRPGAGGNIGTDLAAKAAPDGYTLLMGSTGPQAINPAVYRDLPFDVLRDLAPVSLVAQLPNALVINPAVPARTVKELIALAKTEPGRLRYGSSGYGTTLHLSGELFASLAGIQMLHVPYRGTAPAIADVASGQIDLVFAAVPSVLPMVQAGRLRMLAVTTPSRSAALPDIPTVAESGLPGYEMTPWFGVFTSAGTPAVIVRKLNDEIRKIVAAPSVNDALARQGAEPLSNSPEEFESLLRAEIAKWSRVVKEAGITVN
ncbi:MAG: tripartite tricarboxylate transporter substrate binding protein [Gammaproteobacteria bacterium]